VLGLGAVVPIYNLAGVSRPLNLTPETLAGIQGPTQSASFTWLLPPLEQADHTRQGADRLRWILSDGQKECSELGPAPLPGEVVERESQALTSMK